MEPATEGATHPKDERQNKSTAKPSYPERIGITPEPTTSRHTLASIRSVRGVVLALGWDGVEGDRRPTKEPLLRIGERLAIVMSKLVLG